MNQMTDGVMPMDFMTSLLSDRCEIKKIKIVIHYIDYSIE